MFHELEKLRAYAAGDRVGCPPASLLADAVDELTLCRTLLDSYDFHQTGIHNGIMAMNNRIQKLEYDLRLFKAQHGE